MADAKPLKYEELAEVGAFEKFIGNIGISEEKIKSLESAVVSLKKELGGSARKSSAQFTGADDKSIDTIRKLQQEIDRLRKAEKGLTEAEKMLAYVKEKNRVLDKQALDAIKANVAVQNTARGSIAEMRAELKKVTIEWENLKDAAGANAEQFKKLSDRKLELTNKLKALEEATGDHRRSVGNYQKGLKGLSSVLLEVARAAGLDTEVIEGLKEAHKELFKIGKELKEGLHGLGIGHKQAGKAATEEAAATVVANQAKSASIPIIGWVAAGIATLTAIVYAYIQASKEAKLEEMERSRAADGTIIINKELRDVYNENIIAIKETSLAYKLLRGEISDYDADIERLKAKTIVDITNAMNEGKAKAQEAGTKGWKDWAADLMRGMYAPLTMGLSLLFDSGDEMAEERRKKVEEENEKYYDQLERQAQEAGKKIELAKIEAQIQANYNNAMKLIDQQRQLDEIHGEERIKVYRRYLIRQRELAIKEAIRRNKDISAAELQTIRNEYNLRIEELKRREAEEGARKMQSMQKQAKEQEQLESEIIQRNLEVQREKMEELLRLQEQAAKDHVLILQVEASRAERVRKDSFVERLKAARAEYELILNDEKSSHAEKVKAHEDFEKKKSDISKEYEQKRVNDMVAFQKQVTDYFDQAFNRRIEMQRNALQYETQLIDSEIQQQLALAQQGQENILGETIKAKAESLAKQKELDRKAQREKQILQMAEIFMEYEKAFIAQGAQSASAKALIKTLEAKGIAEGLAAAFAEEGGILGQDLATDYKLFSKKHKTGQEVVVQAQKGEGFVSLKDMEALKRGMIPEWMSKVYNPEFDTAIGASVVPAAQINELKETVREFKKVIEDRPSIEIGQDLLGNLVIKKGQNGRYQHYIQRQSEIVRRDKWND